MAAAAPLASGTYVLLWTVPDFDSTLAAFFWYLFFYCGFQTMLTVSAFLVFFGLFTPWNEIRAVGALETCPYGSPF